MQTRDQKNYSRHPISAEPLGRERGGITVCLLSDYLLGENMGFRILPKLQRVDLKLSAGGFRDRS